MEALFEKGYSGINSRGEKFVDMIIPGFVTANGVTIFRALLAFPVIWFFSQAYYGLAIACYVVAGVLDYFDGALARSRKQTTDFGKFLDPMADKFVIITVGSYLLIKFCLMSMEWWCLKIVLAPFILLVLFEIILSLKRIKDYLSVKRNSRKPKDLSANIWGKVKFCGEVLGVGFFLLTPWSEFFVIISLLLFPVSVFFAQKSLGGKR